MTKPNLDIIYNGFPSYLKADIDVIVSKIDFKTEHESNQYFQVLIEHEIIYIPYRVYYDKQKIKTEPLDTVQKDILHCILTRHNDGYVREQYLNLILNSTYYWTSPYICQLIGEYVVEIDRLIYSKLDTCNISNLSRFMIDNPDFISKTEQRAISYWDCYYRLDYPKKEEFEGLKIIKILRDKLNNDKKAAPNTAYKL